MSAVSEVLNESADIIERQGWSQRNGMAPGEGPKCLMGALGQAMDAPVRDAFLEEGQLYCYGAVEDGLATQALVEHIGKKNVGGPYLFFWNDEEGRTAEDVIGVLRAAAVIEEARESQRAPVG